MLLVPRLRADDRWDAGSVRKEHGVDRHGCHSRHRHYIWPSPLLVLGSVAESVPKIVPGLDNDEADGWRREVGWVWGETDGEEVIASRQKSKSESGTEERSVILVPAGRPDLGTTHHEYTSTELEYYI